MVKKIKFVLALSPLIFLSAGCTLFGGDPNVAGVIKTINGGADWVFSNKVPATDTAPATTLDGADIALLGFSNESTEKIYAASYNTGLLVSEDSGVSWKAILSKIAVYDYAEDLSDSKKLYAVGSFGGRGKALVSIDAGGSWQEMYSEASTQDYVRSFAQNPGNLQELYLGMASGNIYVSLDGGVSWQTVTKLNARIQHMRFEAGSLYVLTLQKGLFVSRDAGRSFTNLTQSLIADTSIWSVSTFASSKVNEFYAYVIDQSNTNLMYVSTDTGLFKTTNGAKNWTRLSLPVKSEDTRTRALALSPDGSGIVYTAIGSQIYKSLDGGQNWQTQPIESSGFINALLVHPGLPQIVYAGIYVGN